MKIESAKVLTARSAFSTVTEHLVWLVLAATLLALLTLTLPVAAAPASLLESEECFAPTEPTAPFALAKGPDGNVWYTNEGSTKIGRVTPSCAVTEYSPGLSGAGYGIAKGPDGDIWVTEPSVKKVGHFDPSEPETSLTECSVTNMPAVSFITAGPDGNLWLSIGASGIARVTPACVVSEFATTGNVCSITAGPDGNVWFTTCAAPRGVGKITSGGTITKYEVTGSLGIQSNSIALGSDERLWVSTSKGTTERVAAVTTTGTVSYYPTLANVIYTSFTPGADGNVWARNNASMNEKQSVTIQATESLGGTFKLVYKGEETAAISAEGSAESVKNKLAALSSIGGSANVEVTEVLTPNKVLYTIEFRGKLARTNIEQLTCNASGLTGTEPSCSVTTLVEGTPVKLARITPTGTVTEFPLKARVVFTNNSAKANGLAAGPGASLWYASAGDPAFPASKAIGRFGEAPPSTHGLKVIVIGPGKVVGPGIDCPPFCSADPTQGTKVTLTAIANPSAFFVVWKGCDTGGINGVQCTVTADKEKSVTATFVAAPELTVSKAPGSGQGKVTSYPGGILCLANCSTTTAGFKEGAKVKLNQAPSKHFHFVEWLGDCAGSGLCEVTMGEEHEVEALFGEDPKYSLSLTKKGGGQGTVKSSPAGVNCGYTCGSMDVDFYDDTVVVLTAAVQAGKGSTFAGWSGAGCSGTGTCTVTMDEAKSVEAEFK